MDQLWPTRGFFASFNGKMVFPKLIFFPPNFFFAQKDFPFPKYQKKKFWREKNQLGKKGRSFFNHVS
jgi:hypothetical protein